MTVIFATFGMIVALLLSGAFIIYWISSIRDSNEMSLMRNEGLVRADERKLLGRSMKIGAYWYHESPEAEILVNIIGEHIELYGTYDEHSIREKWRLAMESNKI